MVPNPLVVQPYRQISLESSLRAWRTDREESIGYFRVVLAGPLLGERLRHQRLLPPVVPLRCDLLPRLHRRRGQAEDLDRAVAVEREQVPAVGASQAVRLRAMSLRISGTSSVGTTMIVWASARKAASCSAT